MADAPVRKRRRIGAALLDGRDRRSMFEPLYRGSHGSHLFLELRQL
jgi:hypothetical protein